MFAIFMTDNHGNRFQIDADEGASSVLGCGSPRLFHTVSDAEPVAAHARSGSWASVAIEPVLIVELAKISRMEAQNRLLKEVLGGLYGTLGDMWPRATREEVEQALAGDYTSSSPK